MAKDAHNKAAEHHRTPRRATGWLPNITARASTRRVGRNRRRPTAIRRRPTNIPTSRTARAKRRYEAEAGEVATRPPRSRAVHRVASAG